MAAIASATVTITPRLNLAGLCADLRALADRLEDVSAASEIKVSDATIDAVAGRILLAYEGAV